MGIMRIKKPKDFWSGVMFIAFGLFFAAFGMQYEVGTGARMGPGYFPMVLSMILILLGVGVLLGGLFSKFFEKRLDPFSWRELLFILGSVVLFGLMLKPIGLVVSLFVLIAVSSYASHEFKWRATIINAVVLIAICLLLFVWSLNLPLRLWPFFVGR
jgi:hypothetical protein